MASINVGQRKSNSGAYQLLGTGIGAVYGNPGAGATAGSVVGGMAEKGPVSAVPNAKSEVPQPQAEQGPDPAMQRRLKELEDVRLAAMNKKIYG
jgi:hypothetical protein